MYTRRPRTVSKTRTNNVPSEKRTVSPLAGVTPRCLQIAPVSFWLALPETMKMPSSEAVMLVSPNYTRDAPLLLPAPEPPPQSHVFKRGEVRDNDRSNCRKPYSFHR